MRTRSSPSFQGQYTLDIAVREWLDCLPEADRFEVIDAVIAAASKAREAMLAAFLSAWAGLVIEAGYRITLELASTHTFIRKIETVDPLSDLPSSGFVFGRRGLLRIIRHRKRGKGPIAVILNVPTTGLGIGLGIGLGLSVGAIAIWNLPRQAGHSSAYAENGEVIDRVRPVIAAASEPSIATAASDKDAGAVEKRVNAVRVKTAAGARTSTARSTSQPPPFQLGEPAFATWVSASNGLVVRVRSRPPVTGTPLAAETAFETTLPGIARPRPLATDCWSDRATAPVRRREGLGEVAVDVDGASTDGRYSRAATLSLCPD